MNLITASQLINYSVTCATFLFWRRALRAQNISLDSLPYKSIWQPGAAYVGMTCTLVMAFVGGYTVFLPGQWDVPTFLFSYFMIGLFPILYFGWKLVKRSKVRKAEEVDLKGEVGEIEEYTRNYVPTPPRYVCPFLVVSWVLGYVRMSDADFSDIGMRLTSGSTLSLVVECWLGFRCEGTYIDPKIDVLIS